jgi:hypothetical protein
MEHKPRIRFSVLWHGDASIIHIDCRELESPDIEVIRRHFAHARHDPYPGPIRLLLSLPCRAEFNAVVVALEEEFAQMKTPRTKKSAVVGATVARRVIMAILHLFAGRQLRAFRTDDAAVEWLSE